MIVVSDTSPITTLLQINRVGLLKDLYGDVLIPEAVRRELSVLHPSLPAFCHCVPAENRAEVERLLRELDLGEAEAIVLAKERHADALLIDESEGRSIAAREGVRFIGLVGVLLQAKHQKRLASLKDVLRELEIRTAFQLSEAMKATAIRAAGEE